MFRPPDTHAIRGTTTKGYIPSSYISSGGIELVQCAIVLATCSMYTQCCGCSHSSQRSACLPPYFNPERCIWCVRMYLTYAHWIQIQRRPTELEMAQASGCNTKVVGSTLIRVRKKREAVRSGRALVCTTSVCVAAAENQKTIIEIQGTLHEENAPAGIEC